MILYLVAVAFLTLNGGKPIPCWLVKLKAATSTQEQIQSYIAQATPEQIKAARRCLNKTEKE